MVPESKMQNMIAKSVWSQHLVFCLDRRNP